MADDVDQLIAKLKLKDRIILELKEAIIGREERINQLELEFAKSLPETQISSAPGALPTLHLPTPRPEIVEGSHSAVLPPCVERFVVWGGAVRTRAEAQAAERAADIPILMYHSIDDHGPPELAPYRVTPAAFQEQLRFLRKHGYHSVSLGEWATCIANGTPLPGRPVIITFDDGYKKFITNAAPLLEAADFRAAIMVVTAKVGGVADWDVTSALPLKLMGWDELRDLQQRGFEIGSHTTCHADLLTLSDEAIVRDCSEARAALRDQLGREVISVAFPWGRNDNRVRAALARGGYRIGLAASGGRSSLSDSPMHLPRIEIFGHDDIDTFARRLNTRGDTAGPAQSGQRHSRNPAT